MLLPLFATLVAIVQCQSATRLTRIVAASGSMFIDELGRSRIFRGTNVVSKLFPYVPDTAADASPLVSFNQNDVDILASHGVTAIRLGVIWAGVEPTQGAYNQTYLSELAKIAQLCADNSIYVLLDFHQDSLSERFCGQGVPSYIVDTNPNANSGPFGFPVPVELQPYAVDANGIPSHTDCMKHGFGTDQIANAEGYLYQNIYDNENGVRDRFIEFWKVVAKAFLPFTNILGYDIINEPFMGDILRNPAWIDVLVANQKNLQPFYEVVAEAIRSVDPNAIIHFEPATLVQEHVGFTSPPGGPPFANKSVLHFHYYTAVQKLYGYNDTFAFRKQSAADLGCGVFLGEFEMGYGNLANIPSVFQAADLHLLSATGWEYKEYVPNGGFVDTGVNDGLVDPSTGRVRPDFSATFLRTYAHAIAGTPEGMIFDDVTRIFTLNFTFNGQSGLAGTTEIRTNVNQFYSNGFNVKIAASSGSFHSAANLGGIANSSIFILPDESNMPLTGAQVAVAVFPSGQGTPVVVVPLPSPTKQSWGGRAKFLLSLLIVSVILV